VTFAAPICIENESNVKRGEQYDAFTNRLRLEIESLSQNGHEIRTALK
jgi:hypothetical protein